MDYDVIIVGGGAAGLLCGGTAAREGARVLVAEKMQRPARKILVTGKGRCNVTNNCDEETFFKNVVNNPRFLYSSYAGFSSQNVMALFQEQGTPLKTERGNRVFPVSEKARDVADALVKYYKTGGGDIRQLEVEQLLIEQGTCIGVKTKDGKEYLSSCVVVATGGKSYPGTGSTGDGYLFAKQAGHTVTSLRPSLVSIETEEYWVTKVMGLSLRNVSLKLYENGKKKPVYSELGEMLFTHFGVSGPLVLSASAYMKKATSSYSLAIDLKPALTEEQLDARILRDFVEFQNKDFRNGLEKLLPQALIPIVVKLSGIPREEKINSITKEQRQGLVKILKALPLTPKALGPIEEAVVTSGGVKVTEINPSTMESKLIKNLYFAGEVLDVDAFTGGFNLQIAFSTGHCAGKAAAKASREAKSDFNSY